MLPDRIVWERALLFLCLLCVPVVNVYQDMCVCVFPFRLLAWAVGFKCIRSGTFVFVVVLF